LKIRSSINLPWVTRGPTKKLGRIGSAVLTFVGYKHKTDKQNISVQPFGRPEATYLYECLVLLYRKIIIIIMIKTKLKILITIITAIK